jgi:hypothetical protein
MASISINVTFDDNSTGIVTIPLVVDTFTIPTSSDGKNIKSLNFITAGYYTGPPANLVISDGPSIIGVTAFYSGGFTGSLAIGNSVKTIGNRAFCNCDFTGSLTIGNSVTEIGEGAFYGCGNLSSFQIPTNISIHMDSFPPSSAVYTTPVTMRAQTNSSVNLVLNNSNPVTLDSGSVPGLTYDADMKTLSGTPTTPGTYLLHFIGSDLYLEITVDPICILEPTRILSPSPTYP